MDQNNVKTIQAELVDGSKKAVDLIADETSHRLLTIKGIPPVASDSTYGARNENARVVLIAVSAKDGKTPVPVYCDSNGRLLITK